MLKIYSGVEVGKLLHIVHTRDAFKDGRVDISPDEEYLQVAALKMEGGKTFRPHKHIPNTKITDITQESWVVIQGKVKAFLYDLDDEVACEVLLGPGDLSITFQGGHTYEILEEDTIVYEFKTGPYFGQEKDKVFIDENV